MKLDDFEFSYPDVLPMVSIYKSSTSFRAHGIRRKN
jgi:hypothetical protein